MVKTLKQRKHKGKVSFRNRPNIYNLSRNNSRGRIRQNYTNTNYLYRLSTKNEYNNEQKYLTDENARRKISMLENAATYIDKIKSDKVHEVFGALRIKNKYGKPSEFIRITSDSNINPNEIDLQLPTAEQYAKIKNYMSNNANNR